MSDALAQPHLVVMGRVTYEALAAISSPATDDVSARMSELPKVVVSNTLQEPLAWANTRLIRGDLGEEIGALKRQSPVPLRSIGSLTLVGAMMRLGLVDRLRIMVFPLLLGDAGREPAFAGHQRAATGAGRHQGAGLPAGHARIPAGEWPGPRVAGPQGRAGQRLWPAPVDVVDQSDAQLFHVQSSAAGASPSRIPAARAVAAATSTSGEPTSGSQFRS